MTGRRERTPAQWAEQAAEAVRQLNHATLALDAAAGYGHPAEVDETLGNLLVLVDRLPQALAQMARWLDRQSAEGRVRHDGYLDREESAQQARCAVLELANHLDAAAARLTVVGADLAGARHHSTHLAVFLEDLPDDPDDDGDAVDRADRDGAW